MLFFRWTEEILEHIYSLGYKEKIRNRFFLGQDIRFLIIYISHVSLNPYQCYLFCFPPDALTSNCSTRLVWRKSYSVPYKFSFEFLIINFQFLGIFKKINFGNLYVTLFLVMFHCYERASAFIKYIKYKFNEIMENM